MKIRKKKTCHSKETNEKEFDKKKFTQSEFRWQGQKQNSTVNLMIFDWRSKSNRKFEKKTTFGRENLEELHKISQFQKRKFTQIEFQWHWQMHNSTRFDWTLKSNRKSQKKTNQKDTSKRKFVSITENLIILEEKIYSTRIQMIPTNAEFNGEFNDMPLKIYCEAKIAQKNKKKRHLERKICLNYTKFHNFTRENSPTEDSSDTDKCRIQWWI